MNEVEVRCEEKKAAPAVKEGEFYKDPEQGNVYIVARTTRTRKLALINLHSGSIWSYDSVWGSIYSPYRWTKIDPGCEIVITVEK